MELGTGKTTLNQPMQLVAWLERETPRRAGGILDQRQAVLTITIKGEPWFVAADLCLILGYGNPRQAVTSHVDPEDLGVQKMDTRFFEFPFARPTVELIRYFIYERPSKPSN
jgi:hypothetical protein